MDSWTLIRIVGDVVIVLVSLLGTLLVCGVAVLIVGFVVNRHVRIRASRRHVEREYAGMKESLLTHLQRERKGV